LKKPLIIIKESNYYHIKIALRTSHHCHVQINTALLFIRKMKAGQFFAQYLGKTIGKIALYFIKEKKMASQLQNLMIFGKLPIQILSSPLL